MARAGRWTTVMDVVAGAGRRNVSSSSGSRAAPATTHGAHRGHSRPAARPSQLSQVPRPDPRPPRTFPAGTQADRRGHIRPPSLRAPCNALQRAASDSGMDADAQIVDARAALAPLPAQPGTSRGFGCVIWNRDWIRIRLQLLCSYHKNQFLEEVSDRSDLVELNKAAEGHVVAAPGRRRRRPDAAAGHTQLKPVSKKELIVFVAVDVPATPHHQQAKYVDYLDFI